MLKLKKSAAGIALAVAATGLVGVAAASPASAAPARVYTGQQCVRYASESGIWPDKTTWTLTSQTWDTCVYRKFVRVGFYTHTSTVYLGKIRKDCGPAIFQKNC